MLHLLDPDLHRLDDLEAFRERVRMRQEIGHVLLSLQEGSPSYVIQPSLERLRELFPGDARIAQLACGLESAAGTSLSEEEQDRAIRALRVHVSETYRLYRRMLRNRRSTVTADAILGRVQANGSQTPRILETDLDERSPKLYGLLEDWREAASFAAKEADRAGAGRERESDLVHIFSILIQAAGTWLGLLEEVIRCRLGWSDLDALPTEFQADALKALGEATHFEGELDILEAMLDLLREPSEEGDRLALLEASLENARRTGRGGIPSKCVVFTSFARTCDELLRHLRAAFGERAVAGYHRGLTQSEVEREVSRFRQHAECFVLICDRCGEEGRNLQFAERVVHFDLPLSPNRMEQRIGRLDRIGRTRPVRSTIFIGPERDGTLFAAWYSVLNDGFRVFDRSIASLQFYVDESLPELILTLFREGTDGVLARIPSVQRGCADEEARIAEQDALDTIDALDTDSAACFEAISELETAHAELEDDLHSWVGESLGFYRDHDFRRVEGTTLYKPNVDRRFNELHTLVPIDWLHRRFLPHLDRPGAFDRGVALRHEGTPLFRIGDGFVDAMAEYIRWDDRGRAFALWRHEPSFDPREGAEWIGFRFNYIVSADLKDAGRFLLEDGLPESAVRSLERWADALFPPLAEVVFLDTDLNPVTDQQILRILERPYRAHDRRGTDYSLANERLAVLDQLVPSTRWVELCGRARAASATEVMGRGTPPLRERCAELARDAERALGARVEQLRLRAGYERSGGERPGLARELLREELVSQALVRGIDTPSLRLDSVGFIVVSGRPPLCSLKEDDE
jgi:ATP-dependent helicase HepA